MKSLPLFILVAALASMQSLKSFAQNTDPWPSSGSVGIGTSSPDTGTKLQVVGGILTSGAFSSTVGSTGGIDYYGGGLRLFSMGTSGANKGTFSLIAKGADDSSVSPFSINASQIFTYNSSSVNIGTFNTTQTGFYTSYSANGTPRGYIGTGDQLLSGGDASDFAVTSNATLKFGTNATTAFTLNSSQVFTHNSSVANIGTFNTTQSGFYTQYSANGTVRGYIGTGDQLLTGGGVTDFAVTSNDVLKFGTNGTTALTISSSQNVGVGTSSPDSKLTVAGKIHSQEVKVSVAAGADFVFEKDYKLKSLDEVAEYISVNKHLPEVASAADMKKNGLELGEMNIKLLQKIEELTLHLIEQNKDIRELKVANNQLRYEVNQLKSNP